MTTLLTNIVPAPVRQKLYLGYALVGLILGGIQVGYSSAGLGQPTWCTVVTGVFAFVGGALGLTAAANTKPASVGPAAGQPGVVSPLQAPMTGTA